MQEYEKKWRAELGRDIDMGMVVKDRFTRMTDDELNTLAHSLEGVDLGSTTLIGLVWALFKANKKLLWDLRSIFIGIKEIESEVKREVYT